MGAPKDSEFDPIASLLDGVGEGKAEGLPSPSRVAPKPAAPSGGDDMLAGLVDDFFEPATAPAPRALNLPKASLVPTGPVPLGPMPALPLSGIPRAPTGGQPKVVAPAPGAARPTGGQARVPPSTPPPVAVPVTAPVAAPARAPAPAPVPSAPPRATTGNQARVPPPAPAPAAQAPAVAPAPAPTVQAPAVGSAATPTRAVAAADLGLPPGDEPDLEASGARELSRAVAREMPSWVRRNAVQVSVAGGMLLSLVVLLTLRGQPEPVVGPVGGPGPVAGLGGPQGDVVALDAALSAGSLDGRVGELARRILGGTGPFLARLCEAYSDENLPGHSHWLALVGAPQALATAGEAATGRLLKDAALLERANRQLIPLGMPPPYPHADSPLDLEAPPVSVLAEGLAALEAKAAELHARLALDVGKRPQAAAGLAEAGDLEALVQLVAANPSKENEAARLELFDGYLRGAAPLSAQYLRMLKLAARAGPEEAGPVLARLAELRVGGGFALALFPPQAACQVAEPEEGATGPDALAFALAALGRAQTRALAGRPDPRALRQAARATYKALPARGDELGLAWTLVGSAVYALAGHAPVAAQVTEDFVAACKGGPKGPALAGRAIDALMRLGGKKVDPSWMRLREDFMAARPELPPGHPLARPPAGKYGALDAWPSVPDRLLGLVPEKRARATSAPSGPVASQKPDEPAPDPPTEPRVPDPPPATAMATSGAPQVQEPEPSDDGPEPPAEGAEGDRKYQRFRRRRQH